MTRQKSMWVVVMAFCVLLPGTLYADVINGSFEDGFTGFSPTQTNGELEIFSSLGDGIISPTHGTSFLYLSTGPGDVNSDNLGDVTRLVSNSFAVGAGIETLSFDFNVLTEIDVPSTFFVACARVHFAGEIVAESRISQDRLEFQTNTGLEIVSNAFYSIPGGISSPDESSFTKQTGWHHVVVDVTELAGLALTQSMEFTIYDTSSGTEIFDSALLVDNIRLDPHPAPVPPVANAGPDQIVFDEITLDGTGSTDPDGTIESYEWHITHRDNPSYDSIVQAQTPVVSSFAPGFYDVILTVTNNEGIMDTDTMMFGAIGRKGDLNLDGDIDGLDLSEFAEVFGSPF